MWLCLNDGFLSVVADKNDQSRLMVRARRKNDLLSIFGPDAKIVETPEADYRWRTFVTRAALRTVVDSRIDAISYTNFKNTVKDDDLHEVYMEFWNTHRHYQDEDRPEHRLDRSGQSGRGSGDSAHKPKRK
jgi:hypothetical protein